MKVVALISGGKDSCYNMMQCVAAGHTIVALANLRPVKNTDELDSYMYQTVGHEAIDLYAEAMDLPLYRRTIEGSSLDTGREYSQREGDEVEDLYHLLKLVKEKESVEAVSVGAILSDYQRVRVENVCARLQLQPLAYLWRRDQESLLSEMISRGIHALLIKVAAVGLDPEKHLGKSLAEMEPHLKQLSQKYGVHICGEGGEYETFTTDCPLFKKKIVVDAMETVIHSADAFAPVGYLRLTQMHIEDKGQGPTASPLPLGTCPCQSAIDKMTEEAEYADKTQAIQEEFTSNSDLSCQRGHEPMLACSPRSVAGYQWLAGISGAHGEQEEECSRIQAQTKQAFTRLQDELQRGGWKMKDIVLVHLYVRDMADFKELNSVYVSHFGSNPPARVCVEAPLPAGHLLQMDCLLHAWTQPPAEGCFQSREAMHVQSLSHWAPANIGPYSQAVRVDEAAFCAGQIALVPCSMQLVAGGAARQAQLCFGHMARVLEALSSSLTLHHALQAHCYVTQPGHIPAAKAVWQRMLGHAEEDSYEEPEMHCGPLVVAVVPSLPRGAAVELHVMAVQDEPAERTFSQTTTRLPGAILSSQLMQAGNGHCATLSLSVSTGTLGLDSTKLEPGVVLGALGSAFLDSVKKLDQQLSPLCCRGFYKLSNAVGQQLATGLEECLKQSLGQVSPAVVLVPVLDLPDGAVLHLSCWLST
ncbi:diphthine--ammonia ligase isoform X1 [Alosa sapidissima]|uniref:diphthine--ammonia ligase isoform X1 n=1 Tax=Alosa sapidissima TaxID=34773 RepID=UPI001C09A92A|nr:diphthine--ammonia ligase isoform X1 [Alosa sapidissima]